MSKGVKIGLGIAGILLVLLVLYYLLRKPAVSWKAIPGGDISGVGFDIATDDSNLSLDAAKARAAELGALSFLKNGSRTIFKNASTPVSTTTSGTWTLYVKQ